MRNTTHQISQRPSRVLIVDGQAMVRSGLRLALLAFDELELVGETNSIHEALQLCAEARPDVALVDLQVQGLDAARVIRAIVQRFPQVKVMALSSFAAEERVQEALKAGASGYLLKNVSAEELVKAIRAVHAGQPLPKDSTPSEPGRETPERRGV